MTETPTTEPQAMGPSPASSAGSGRPRWPWTMALAAAGTVAAWLAVGASSGSTGAGDAEVEGVPSCVQGRPGGPTFRPVFEEEFDGPTVDPDQWFPYHSVGNAGFGLRRPEAVAVTDGRLVITARMVDGVLVSGGMSHRLDQTYGRWEFRVRTDSDPSGATSGVVLTWPQSENWPVDGESDIYETGRDAARRPVYSFVHYGVENSFEERSYDIDGTQWHDLAMEWTRDEIVVFVDGTVAGRIDRPEAIPHGPHHLTIQLDAWAEEMGDPVTMEIERVRVYRWEEDGC